MTPRIFGIPAQNIALLFAVIGVYKLARAVADWIDGVRASIGGKRR